jgi:Holliday junction resolvasome RuvABC DNA-binding subunit
VAGVAQPTARELGNALKRFVDKRSDGIARKLTRRVDGHGFAIWQVVDDPDAPNPAPERPAKADLVRSALTGTGYRSAEADYAVSALGARVDTEPLAELVREALGVLARRSAPGLHRKGR